MFMHSVEYGYNPSSFNNTFIKKKKERFPPPTIELTKANDYYIPAAR
jgi:hypothetical protein